MSVQTVRCECGLHALAERFFSDRSWETRVGCKACGISCGKGDDMVAAVATWNRIQGALAPKSDEITGARTILVLTGVGHQDDYRVHSGTIEQMGNVLKHAKSHTAYIAHNTDLTKSWIFTAFGQCRSAASFIAVMAELGVTMERVK